MLHLQDKRTRENIIATHYWLRMEFHGVILPHTVVARDAPHDFTFQDSEGGPELLLEITSFSDHSSNWTLANAERHLMDALRDAGIANSTIAFRLQTARPICATGQAGKASQLPFQHTAPVEREGFKELPES